MVDTTLVEAIRASLTQATTSAASMIEAAEIAFHSGLKWYVSLIHEGYNPFEANETVTHAMRQEQFLLPQYDMVDLLASHSRPHVTPQQVHVLDLNLQPA